MIRNMASIGLGLCAAGCLALAAVPGLAQIACVRGVALAGGGLLLWKPTKHEAVR